jgi:hypothetical protein
MARQRFEEQLRAAEASLAAERARAQVRPAQCATRAHG